MAVRGVLATVVLSISILCSVAEAQVQSKKQQTCINAINSGAARVGGVQGRENLTCLRDAGGGKLEMMTAQQCLTADRRGRIADGILKLTETEAEKCTTLPNFAYTGSDAASDGARAGSLLSFADVFTANADVGIIDCDADSKGCACQKAVAGSTEKLMKLKSQLFVKCKKSVLKEGATSTADVAKCVNDPATAGSIAADSQNKVQKAIDAIAKKIAKVCDMHGVTLDAVSSHAKCAGLQGAALASCLDPVTNCRVCQTLNAVDALGLDCDLFDNGLADASCAALSICFPVASMCDDSQACTVNDTCTAVGCTGTQLVQGTPAAITAQLTSIDANDQVHLAIQIVTLTFNPFSLTAVDVDYKAGLVLESLSSVCTPSGVNKTRCEHDMSFLATSACTGTGTYQLYLNYSCTPAVDGCSLCNDPRTIQFTLGTENWCDETTVLTCGNSQIDFGEPCDGSNLNGQTCQTRGYFGGTLTCNACAFDISGCQAPRAFITSTTYDGSLGGLAGLDSACQTRAAAAGMGGSTWKAWASSSTTDARERSTAVRYQTMSGTVITSNGANLFGGGLAANISLSELNGSVSGTAFTGTKTDGTKAANTCTDWSTTAGTATIGTNTNPAMWTDNAVAANCTGPQRLYCFEQLPYKRVFLTSTTYTGALGGLAGADAKCQARANAGKLGGTWKAWLSTSTVSAKDRIPDSEYRLIDLSTVVATSKVDLIDGAISNHIIMDEMGALRGSFVWTGTTFDGVTTGGTCNNWLSGAQNISVGSNVGLLTEWSNTAQIAGCASNTLRLYCFEQ